jgi:hypothetical protein
MTDCTQKLTQAPAPAEELELEEKTGTQMDKALSCLAQHVDLEGSARYSGALCRKRVIQTAQNLLKLVLVYALTDTSLRMVGLWGTLMGWGSLSKSGVRKRLRQCQEWIGVLIVAVLLRGQLSLPKRTGMRLRLFDASSVSQPGSHKIDWRLHLGFDLSAGRITDVQLTDGKQGESLTRWQFAPDDICLADRYSGVPRALGVLLGAAAWFVIRLAWRNLPLQDREGRPFSLAQWLAVQSSDPSAAPAQVAMWVNTPQGRFPVRVIARAIPPDKAKKIRQNLQAEAKRKKTRLDERTPLAAGFVMVVSNLPESTWSAGEILALYRFRWQIELVFKRLKSILTFDHLRATDPQLAQVYLLTKLLIALLLTEAEWCMALAAPESFQNPDRPLSRWRFTQLALEAFRQSVCGSLTWDKIFQHLSQLDRYLCDEPRRRQSQLTSLRNLGMVCGF